MNILKNLSAPWAMKPEALSNVVTYVHNQLLNLKNIEDRILNDSKIILRNYEIRDGVAIIPITGPISKNPDIFDSALFDMISSSRQIMDDFSKAHADSDVRAIVLHIDSPGGTVDGTQELARHIYKTKKKPVIAYSDGMIASAAYWIGSAADKIYLSSETAEAGSIGVYMVHYETSEMAKIKGVNITEITAGKYKASGSSRKPLSSEDKAYLQDRVDYLYQVFVNDVATFRGLPILKVLNMADGKMFMGNNAVKIGLVDGITTMEQAIQGLK